MQTLGAGKAMAILCRYHEVHAFHQDARDLVPEVQIAARTQALHHPAIACYRPLQRGICSRSSASSSSFLHSITLQSLVSMRSQSMMEGNECVLERKLPRILCCKTLYTIQAMRLDMGKCILLSWLPPLTEQQSPL